MEIKSQRLVELTKKKSDLDSHENLELVEIIGDLAHAQLVDIPDNVFAGLGAIERLQILNLFTTPLATAGQAAKPEEIQVQQQLAKQ